jgi:fructokinase
MDETEPLVAGVELGGTKCIAVLARGTTIIAEERIETGEGEPTIHALHNILAEWQRSNPIRALGIASFGPIMLDRADDNYGRLMGTPKPGWQGLDVSRMADGFDGRIAIDTDVNAAALAEWRWGGGAGLDIIAYLTIGTGIGGGLLAHGRTVHGLLHPEMGHVMVRRFAGDEFPGVCKIHGDCLEGLASGPAISARAGMHTHDMPPEHPAWRIAGHYIGEMLANLVLIAAPQRILIGGGVGVAQPQVLAAARVVLAEQLGGYINRPALNESIDSYVATAVLGDQAGPLGAVALAMGVLGA